MKRTEQNKLTSWKQQNTQRAENVNRLLSVFSEMDTTSKAQARKAKTWKWDYIKLCYVAKETT